MGIAQFHKTVGTHQYASTSYGPVWVPKQNKGLMKEYKAEKRREAEERNFETPYNRTKAYRRDVLGTLDKLRDAEVGPFDYESVIASVTNKGPKNK